jgi:hypothetical protein
MERPEWLIVAIGEHEIANAQRNRQESHTPQVYTIERFYDRFGPRADAWGWHLRRADGTIAAHNYHAAATAEDAEALARACFGTLHTYQVAVPPAER